LFIAALDSPLRQREIGFWEATFLTLKAAVVTFAAATFLAPGAL
jgi:hypothetical protein